MTYVMSDIHGNYERFISIMQQIDLKDTDTLYVLGDVVDRFSDGLKILQRLMKMPNVKMLLGNHEYMLMNTMHALDEGDEYMIHHTTSLWYHNSGRCTHICWKHLSKTLRSEILSFIENLPYEYNIEVNGVKYKLVHGQNPEKYNSNNRYNDVREFSVWDRVADYEKGYKDFILVFGHTPTYFLGDPSNPMCVWDKREKGLLGIDCGSGYSTELGGRLACVRLDDMKVFYSDKSV